MRVFDKPGLVRVASIMALVAAGLLHPAHVEAQSLAVELRDVAPDRVERQRAEATGALPLPGTPDLSNLEQRLADKGVKAGDAMFIRVFKAESQLEVWLKRGSTFVLLDTYPICYWSGTLGPKIREGDKQNPEGFYTVTRSQLHLVGRHPRSLNLGFPNPLDKAMGRTGSYILVHGGCSSIGCFAMTNAVMAEIYGLAAKALQAGQTHIHVHAFPFRMTEDNLKTYDNSLWGDYWRNLKQGYDAFEATKVPPRISVCDNKYVVEPSSPVEVGDAGPLALCGATAAALQELDRLSPGARQLEQARLRQQSLPANFLEQLARLSASPSSVRARRMTTTTTNALSARDAVVQQVALPAVQCSQERPSCRRWIALQRKMAAKRAVAAQRVAARASPSRNR